MSEEHEISELVRRDAMEALRNAWRQAGKTQTKTMLFLSTLTKVIPMKEADPVAAERAKRYIWSRIERNQVNDWRAE